MSPKKTARRQPLQKPPSLVVRLLTTLISWIAILVLTVGGFTALTIGLITIMATPRSPQNVVIVNKTIDAEKGALVLASLDPQESRAQFMTFDPHLKTQVVGGYGSYELRAVYPLLTLDEQSTQTIVTTLTFSLDRVVDQIWTLERVPAVSSEEEARQLLRDIAWGSIPSDLAWHQRAWLWWFAQRLEISRTLFDHVGSESALAKTDFLSLAFKPDCTIAVVNTTSAAGLARQVTQILENSGGRIVRTTDSPDNQAHSKVVVNPEADCMTVAEKVSRIIPQTITPEENQELSLEQRAEVVLFLGEDVATLVTGQGQEKTDQAK